MTTIDLYRKHKAGEVSREKFLYEVRRDNNLPFITNLTSYDDAVKILKNRGIVTEVDTKEAKADEAVKAEVKPKAPTTTKPKTLHLDIAHPYEYRLGLQQELNTLGEYTDEAFEKAKVKVLKNLAKDANFYTTLLNAKTSPYEFKKTETDAKGMQARPDGYMKKEAKKDEKANVKDNLGNKEAGTTKPKDTKVMPDKGVTGTQKTIKEGIDDKVEDMIKSGKIKPEEVKAAAEKAMKGDSSELAALMAGFKLAEDTVEETKENKYIYLDNDGDEMLDNEAIADYLRSVIDPEYIDSVDTFMDDDEGYGESATYFFDSSDDDLETTEQQVEDWAKQEMSYYLFSSSDEFPVKEGIEEGSFMGGVDLGSSFDKMKQDIVGNKEDFELADENALEDALKSHDWYYMMSDDPRAYEAGSDEKSKISSLMKKVPRKRAVELYNKYCPKDWKLQNEDKHASLKEKLKQGLKELISPADVAASKRSGKPINVSKSNTQDIKALQNAQANFTTYE